MSSSTARGIADADLVGLKEEQHRILAAQAVFSGPIAPELLTAIDEGVAEAERDECVDAEVVLRELRARRFTTG